MKLLLEVEGRQRTVEVEVRDGRAVFAIDGEPLEAEAVEIEPGVYSILYRGRSFQLRVQGGGEQYQVDIAGRPHPYQVARRDRRGRRGSAAAFGAEGPREIASPMPGRVVRVLVEEQQRVKAGQGLVVVEAMKMQNEIRSPKAGIVVKVAARPGTAINAGETLLVVE